MRILATSYKFKECDKELAFNDLEKLHTIRGRILHLSTIVERVFRENISKEDYYKFKEECKIKTKEYDYLTFFQLIKLFINKYEQKYNDSSFKKIKKDLYELKDNYRNLWSHGFVFYELFEMDTNDNKYKPINYIHNKYPVPVHYKDNYFNRANELFSHIIYWLYCEKLLNIERYNLELQISQEEADIIEESMK